MSLGCCCYSSSVMDLGRGEGGSSESDGGDFWLGGDANLATCQSSCGIISCSSGIFGGWGLSLGLLLKIFVPLWSSWGSNTRPGDLAGCKGDLSGSGGFLGSSGGILWGLGARDG